MSPSLRSSSVLEVPREIAHLYVLKLEPLARQLDEMAAVLSAEEQARAARFRFQRDRFRFLLGRAALRHTLSAYVGKSPERLQFDYGVYGKPCLHTTGGTHAVCFNASGSQGLVAIAVGQAGNFGVDIERVRSFDDWRLVVRHQFTAFEQDALFQLPWRRQLEAFFYVWTIKEAVLKRTGQGLRQGLDHIEVGVESLENATVQWRQPAMKWMRPGAVWTFQVGHIAFVALATDIQVKEVRQGDYPAILRPAAMEWRFRAEARLGACRT